MLKIFCKATECQWNRWNDQHLKHCCKKNLVHLNKNGQCRLAEFARPIAPNKPVEPTACKMPKYDRNK